MSAHDLIDRGCQSRVTRVPGQIAHPLEKNGPRIARERPLQGSVAYDTEVAAKKLAAALRKIKPWAGTAA